MTPEASSMSKHAGNSRTKESSMKDQPDKKPLLVIPCSGIGKVHGLLSREATYLVTDEIAPGKTDTMCLALLVKGDSEALDAVKSQACITIDGCPKACAEKNVKIAGGNPAKIVQVADALKKHRGANPGSATELTKEGWVIAREIAATVADAAAALGGGKEESR
jgi:uncharacterized metal-binding protein